MKRTIAAIIATVFAVTSFALPATAGNDDYLSGISLKEDEWLILTSEGVSGATNSMLALQPGAVGIGGTRGDWYECGTMANPACNTKAALQKILAWSMLSECTVSSSEICLESFRIGPADGELKNAKFVSSAGTYGTFPGDRTKNLLEGGSAALFESEHLHAGGSGKYGVAIRLSQFWDDQTKKFYANTLQAYIYPYNSDSETRNTACIFRTEGDCQLLQDFAENTRVELKFRVPNTVGGWFSGRMKTPEISVAKFNSKINTITISSEPVKVNALGLVKSYSKFTPIEKMWQQNHGKGGFNGGWVTGANTWQPDVFDFIDYYRKPLNDTSIGSNTVWNMATLGYAGGNGCLADKSKVLGIVTTNALGYEGEAPQFRNGFLDYKVAGLHYEADGKTLVEGSYDLVMRSETARCLYGFSNAPLSATVSVTGGTSKNVATTVVSEKNGWLRMAAYGFTFSKKTIKVKITKAKKTTITCVATANGKIRKVTAVNPVCAKGFVKK